MIAGQNSFNARSYSSDASVFCASCLRSVRNKKTSLRFFLGTKVQLRNRKI